jgi:hypothetical protein
MRNLRLDGMCPRCKEWTEAGESCCSRGAIVDGDLITDDMAEEMKEDQAFKEARAEKAQKKRA